MLEGMLAGFSHFSGWGLAFILIGIVSGTVVGIIPGLGGMFILSMMLPFTYGLESAWAIGMMLAALAVIGTSNTITSVLFGVPGNVGGVASVFDGYPLARKGQAARALGAAFTASVVGGLIGALCLAAVLPFVKPLILLFGPSEFFMLILIALVMMAFIGSGDPIKALLSGAVGLMIGLVGMEQATGTLRYTYGQLYLWDGIPIIPAVIGLFALAEMMLLLERNEGERKQAMIEKGSGTLSGMLDVLRKWKTTLSSSIVGVFVGLLPGLGGETAQYLAYSTAAKLSPRGKHFGTGEIEGVIAADAATNSKDGGTMIPTLLLGIPGSAPTALLLTSLIMFGIQPGRGMLEENLDLTWFLLYVLIFSNLVAGVICLLLARWLARLSLLRPCFVVPPVLAFSLFGAYVTNGHVGDILIAIGFGFLGYYMARNGYSRAILVVALVLGPLLEKNLLLAMRIYGMDFVFRPIALGLLIIALLIVLSMPLSRAFRLLRRRLARQPRS